MAELREVVREWAREHRINDGHLATLLGEIKDELLTVRPSHSTPAKPAVGIVCRGHWYLGNTMRWRAMDLADHTVLFRRGGPAGSINVAEFLAVMDTFQWCDELGLETPIYTASYIAHKWVKERIFNTSQEVEEEVLERVRRFNLADYPRHLLHYWDEEMWGATPVDYGGSNYKQKWAVR